MMKINHTIAHYLIGAVALAGASAAYVHQPTVQMVPTAEIKEVTHVRVSRFDWPALGEQKTIDLGEAISKISPNSPRKVVIFCSAAACQNFRTDLDDAFQIAWWTSEFEDRFVDSESDYGISVGPAGNPEAQKLAAALKKATGAQVNLVDLTTIEGSPMKDLGVIIGKAEGR